MTPPKIIRVPILPFGMVNAHIIVGKEGCVLVDTGLPGSESRIRNALARNRLSFADVRLIVVTHAHVDHAGNAALLRRLTRAPLVGHHGDAQYFSRKALMAHCPTGAVGSLFLMTPIPREPYSGFEPDIMLADGEELDLGQYGISGTLVHTPGHTSGSISVVLSDREALVGDLVASGMLLGSLVPRNRAIRPPFEDDPRAVARELMRLLARGVERFHLGHGGPLRAGEVRRHARTLTQI